MLHMMNTLLSNTVLTGDNYVEWKTNINLVLTSFDFEFVLTDRCPSEKASKEDRVRWIEGNRIVRSYLLANMSGPLRAKHEGKETAQEIVESLEKMFSQNHFLEALVNTRMIPGTSVRAHVLNTIERISVAMDQATQVRMVLETLSPDFVPFGLDYFENMKLYTTAELLRELQEFESRNLGGMLISGQKRKFVEKSEYSCYTKDQCSNGGGDCHWKKKA